MSVEFYMGIADNRAEEIVKLKTEIKHLVKLVGEIVGCKESWQSCENFNSVICETRCGNSKQHYKLKKDKKDVS